MFKLKRVKIIVDRLYRHRFCVLTKVLLKWTDRINRRRCSATLLRLELGHAGDPITCWGNVQEEGIRQVNMVNPRSGFILVAVFGQPLVISSGMACHLVDNPFHSFNIPVSGRSTTSQAMQIIARSSYNVAKNYGSTLPVLVTEALTFSERNADVSVGCSASEFAWAVCGRRLLVWQFRESRSGSPQRRRGLASQCRELTLPHCDIGHRASLVTVFQSEGQPMASCLAVSPTGDVRYWPSIAHDGSSVDESIGWEGQEFHELSPLTPTHQLGYILGTTTCNMVLLQIQLAGGRHQIQHRNLKTPAGFFGGFGKRFASIIIGMQSQEKENVSGGRGREGSCY